jgi:hypothetical protein
LKIYDAKKQINSRSGVLDSTVVMWNPKPIESSQREAMEKRTPGKAGRQRGIMKTSMIDDHSNRKPPRSSRRKNRPGRKTNVEWPKFLWTLSHGPTQEHWTGWT